MQRYGIEPMFNVANPADRAMGGMNAASNTMASLDKEGPDAPGKTAGGAIMNAAGGGAVAGALGASLKGGMAAGMGGPMGIAVGAGVGLAAYYLS